MRRTSLAASVVLALAGSSHGFVVNQFAVQPGRAITPSSGSFVNYSSGYYTGPGSVVTDARSTWQSYGASILNTTWLATDPAGGGVDIDGYTNSFSRVLAGPGNDPSAPEFSGSTANYLGAGTAGVDSGLLNDGSAILGGSAGISWGAGAGASLNAPSSVSPVNDEWLNSIFFGYFVLTDPNAVLTGAPLLMAENLGGGQSSNWFLPLDGTQNTQSGRFRIEYEEHLTPSQQGHCPGDLDGDGNTDVVDLGLFASAFASTGLPPFTGGDFDGDGDCDVFDFTLFAPHFGCSTPAPIVYKVLEAYVVAVTPPASSAAGPQVVLGPPTAKGLLFLADIDHDGDTDASDFDLFRRAFGMAEEDPSYIPAADLNGDRVLDFARFGGSFESVPE